DRELSFNAASILIFSFNKSNGLFSTVSKFTISPSTSLNSDILSFTVFESQASAPIVKYPVTISSFPCSVYAEIHSWTFKFSFSLSNIIWLIYSFLLLVLVRWQKSGSFGFTHGLYVFMVFVNASHLRRVGFVGRGKAKCATCGLAKIVFKKCALGKIKTQKGRQ